MRKQQQPQPPAKKMKMAHNNGQQQSETLQQQQQVNYFYFDRKVIPVEDKDDEEDDNRSSNDEQQQQKQTQIHQKSSKSFSKNDIKPCQHLLETEFDDCASKSTAFMDWLLFPAMTSKQFIDEYFEKRVLFIQRHPMLSNYYDGVFSSQEHIPQLLKSGKLEYTYDLDITLYKNGVRYTLNPSYPKTVDQDMVMDFFNHQKCSVRFLRPHQHVDNICSMLAQFEEFFQMGSGCNAYWTPANSQGFSPHFDDVDVFILQLEGSKIWSLYQARDPSEILPDKSSPNFTQEEVTDYLVTTVELKAGDLLYCPRGTIHQAHTNNSTNAKDSLHITISTAQHMSWRKYLELAIPRAIEHAASLSQESAMAFNQSLPIGFGGYMGLIHEARDSEESDAEEDVDRQQFRDHLTQLMEYIAQSIPVDDVADEMFIKFLHDRLPPQMALTKKQREDNGLVEVSAKEEDDEDDEMPANTPKVSASSRIRFISKNVARLVVSDEEKCSLFHSLSNTRIYHEIDEADKLEFAIEYAPAISHLLETYPKFSTVSELPELEAEEQLVLAQTLVEQRLAFCVNTSQPKQKKITGNNMSKLAKLRRR